MKYIFFLLIPMLCLGQSKPVKINILSVSSIDSIPEERKFTLEYAIENTTNKEISFFLEPEKLFPTHSNAMGTGVFYKLFQENDELIINGVFTNKRTQKSFKIPDFSSIKDEKERENAFKDFFEKRIKAQNDSINKEKGISASEVLKQRTSKSLMNSVYTLKPKEIKTYSVVWYWDKKRYFKRDEFEYYLKEKGTFYIQLYLFLMKEQYQIKLTKEDFEMLLKIPNFIKGVYQSEKVEINFKE